MYLFLWLAMLDGLHSFLKVYSILCPETYVLYLQYLNPGMLLLHVQKQKPSKEGRKKKIKILTVLYHSVSFLLDHSYSIISYK